MEAGDMRSNGDRETHQSELLPTSDKALSVSGTEQHSNLNWKIFYRTFLDRQQTELTTNIRYEHKNIQKK